MRFFVAVWMHQVAEPTPPQRRLQHDLRALGPRGQALPQDLAVGVLKAFPSYRLSVRISKRDLAEMVVDIDAGARYLLVLVLYGCLLPIS